MGNLTVLTDIFSSTLNVNIVNAQEAAITTATMTSLRTYCYHFRFFVFMYITGMKFL